jgi:hypothetical protein
MATYMDNGPRGSSRMLFDSWTRWQRRLAKVKPRKAPPSRPKPNRIEDLEDRFLLGELVPSGLPGETTSVVSTEVSIPSTSSTSSNPSLGLPAVPSVQTASSSSSSTTAHSSTEAEESTSQSASNSKVSSRAEVKSELQAAKGTKSSLKASSKAEKKAERDHRKFNKGSSVKQRQADRHERHANRRLGRDPTGFGIDRSWHDHSAHDLDTESDDESRLGNDRYSNRRDR